jgi:putative ABC transport system ATP-binding protein
MSILKLENVSYSYNNGKGIKTNVLHDISYEFKKGKVYAIVGKSGAGKTTLLSLLSGLATPDGGRILFDGYDIKKMDKYNFRSRDVGVIFQSFNLLPHLTAIENVELSMDISGKRIKNKHQTALKLLNGVDIDDTTAKRRILKLSGGEQQRVAIARALCYDPDIILADEPTGNLDMGTQQEVISILKSLAERDNKCIIIVTHSPDIAASADEVYQLEKSNPQAEAK